MIYYIDDLFFKYKKYKNVYQKIGLEVKNNRLFNIKRGLYTDDLIKDKLLISNHICSPSYISFEYALQYYGLIPERVYTITSASFGKNKNKQYIVGNQRYMFSDINKRAFAEGYTLIQDEFGNSVKIATPEKAICDKLSKISHMGSIRDIKYVLFEDLRINEELFYQLDFKKMIFYASLYKKETLNALIRFLKGELNDE